MIAKMFFRNRKHSRLYFLLHFFAIGCQSIQSHMCLRPSGMRLKFSQIYLNPFAAVCDNCFKATWKLYLTFLKSPGNLCTLPRMRKAA
jgi:hypothetical protein